MENTIQIDEHGFIYIAFIGDQNSNSVKQLMDDTNKVIDQLKKENKPAYILGDMTKIGKQDSGARRTGADYVLHVPYDRIAVFGAPLYIKYVGRLLAKATGAENKVRFFDTKGEAVRWLKT